MHFFDPLLPQLGRPASKSALTTTMITGSNAAGEAIPSHFQFQTAAQTKDMMKLRNNLVQFIPKVRGQFGTAADHSWVATFGMNAKGGMDDEEFEKYIMGSILPLYPDAKDVPGRRVMIKVDSGPGRLNCKLLARLRTLGFYLFPGVPNTTAVTQETDRNYGPFKTQFRQNLDAVVQRRVTDKVAVNLQPWLVGLVVFGGSDPVTGEVVEKSAFEVGFSRDACRNAWAICGAAPMTHACLTDPKVWHEMGDAEDDVNVLMLQVQKSNDLAAYQLEQKGVDPSFLVSQITKVEVDNRPVTEANTKERVEELAKAKTHG